MSANTKQKDGMTKQRSKSKLIKNNKDLNGNQDNNKNKDIKVIYQNVHNGMDDSQKQTLSLEESGNEKTNDENDKINIS